MAEPYEIEPSLRRYDPATGDYAFENPLVKFLRDLGGMLVPPGMAANIARSRYVDQLIGQDMRKDDQRLKDKQFDAWQQKIQQSEETFPMAVPRILPSMPTVDPLELRYRRRGGREKDI